MSLQFLSADRFWPRELTISKNTPGDEHYPSLWVSLLTSPVRTSLRGPAGHEIRVGLCGHEEEARKKEPFKPLCAGHTCDCNILHYSNDYVVFVFVEKNSHTWILSFLAVP